MKQKINLKHDKALVYTGYPLGKIKSRSPHEGQAALTKVHRAQFN